MTAVAFEWALTEYGDEPLLRPSLHTFVAEWGAEWMEVRDPSRAPWILAREKDATALVVNFLDALPNLSRLTVTCWWSSTGGESLRIAMAARSDRVWTPDAGLCAPPPWLDLAAMPEALVWEVMGS